MRSIPRQRRYVSTTTIILCRPVMCFDMSRDAYVLRMVGRRMGPVLRPDRRQVPTIVEYVGPERRNGARRARSGRGTVAA